MTQYGTDCLINFKEKRITCFNCWADRGDNMKTRTIEEIEKVFREIGLSETTWGRPQVPEPEVEAEPTQGEQIFIRIETTTTPLERKTDANLA